MSVFSHGAARDLAVKKIFLFKNGIRRIANHFQES